MYIRKNTSNSINIIIILNIKTLFFAFNKISISLNNDKSLSITVYFGKKRGLATTSDFSKEAIESCLAAACDIAKFTGEDKAFGLASSKLFPKKEIELDLYHPFEGSQDAMIAKALVAEKAALSFDKRINNSFIFNLINTYKPSSIFLKTIHVKLI